MSNDGMTNDERGPHAEAAASQDRSDDPPIRIGILHLMLWTAGSATLLAFMQAYNWREAEGGYRQLTMIGILLHSLVYGAAIGSLVIWVHRKLNGWRFPITAGHWVLVAYGGLACLGGIRPLIYFALDIDNDPFDVDYVALRMFYAASALLALIGMVVMGLFLALRIPTRWKFFAAMDAIAMAFQMFAMMASAIDLYYLGNSIYTLVTLISGVQLIPLTVCLVTELRDDIKYDALHWTGLAVAIANVMLHIYWHIGSWIVSHGEMVA